MKVHSSISTHKLLRSVRARINPIRHLTPQTLTRLLDNFNAGYLGPAALAWDAIERRDDVLQGVIAKRKKSVSRLHWEIVTIDDSEEAKAQKEALEFFYNHLESSHATDANQRGSLPLLVSQMMDAVGKRYAVHEMIFKPQKGGRFLSANFRFVPLWFFERTTGSLRFNPENDSMAGKELDTDSWMVSHGDGLMEASSIAYLFKHLPMRDWLVYCERNGMPGITARTNAKPDTEDWNQAQDAIESFGAEFHALMGEGTTLEAIDLSTKGELPYPRLIERMDRAMVALWRGSDLSTFARQDATGASVQSLETRVLEYDDAERVSETLHANADRVVLNHLFEGQEHKAYFHLIPNNHSERLADLEIYERLHALGVPLPLDDIRERFSIGLSEEEEALLKAS